MFLLGFFLCIFHPSIKFTKEEGDSSIAFFDIMIIKAEDDTIETDIFYKEANAFSKCTPT